MADMLTGDFIKQLLGSVGPQKPYGAGESKKETSSIKQLTDMMSKVWPKFQQELSSLKSFMKATFELSKKNIKPMRMLQVINEKLSKAYKGNIIEKITQNQNKAFMSMTRPGSIYVHDINTHKLLRLMVAASHTIPTELDDALKSVAEKVTQTPSTEEQALTKTPASDPSTSGEIADNYERSLQAQRDQAEIDYLRIHKINKLQSYVSSIESSFFGLGEKAKSIEETLFGGLIKSEVRFVSEAREAAYELGNVTKETQKLLSATEQIELAVARTGVDRDDFQQAYLKNLKSGIRNQKQAQAISIAQLNTEKQLGMTTGSLAEEFNNLALSGRMTSNQISEMGRGMREVARNTGLTGEALKTAITSSKAFTDNLRKAAQLTAAAATNVMEAAANFQKLGVAEAGGELLKNLTSSTSLLLDSSTDSSRLLYAAAGNMGKIAELQMGTLTRSKKGLKELGQGLENVLKGFGVESLEAIDQLSDQAKLTLNLQLKTAFGMELGEIRGVIEGIKETGKTFGDKLQDIQKKLNQNLTTEEKIQLLEEQRRLKTSQSLKVLTALDEAAKGAKDMNQALETFSKRKSEFEDDITAMGGTFTSGIDAARKSIEVSIDSINEGLKKAGKEGIKIDASEIAKAVSDPTALRELTAKITKGEQELATIQKSQLDPMKATEQVLREYNDMFRSYSQSAITGVMATVGGILALGVAVSVVGLKITLKLAEIQQTLNQFMRKKDGKPGGTKPSLMERMTSGFGGRGEAGGENKTATQAVKGADAANQGAKGAPQTLQQAGNTLGTSARQIALVIGPLLLLAAAMALLIGYVIKKFDLKASDILIATAAITVLILGAAAMIFAINSATKESEKKTGGKFNLGGLLKFVGIGLLLSLAAPLLIGFVIALGSFVYNMIKAMNFNFSEGITVAGGLVQVLTIGGAIIGALAYVLNGFDTTIGNFFSVNMLGLGAKLVVIGLILYLFGRQIVFFLVSLFQFLADSMKAMNLSLTDMLTVSAKFAIIGVVIAIIGGAIYGLSVGVKMLATQLQSAQSALTNLPQALSTLAGYGIAVAAIAAVLLLISFLITSVISPAELISRIIGATAVILTISLAVALITASFALIALSVAALAGAFSLIDKVALAAIPASGTLIVLGIIVALLAVAMIALALAVNAFDIDMGAILSASIKIGVLFLGLTIIAAAMVGALVGLAALAALAAGMQYIVAGSIAAGLALIALAIALPFLIMGVLNLHEIFESNDITLEMIYEVVAKIVLLLAGIALIGLALIGAVVGIVFVGKLAAKFMEKTLENAPGFISLIVGVGILSVFMIGLATVMAAIPLDAINMIGEKFLSLSFALLMMGLAVVVGTIALALIAYVGIGFGTNAWFAAIGLAGIISGLKSINDQLPNLAPEIEKVYENLYVIEFTANFMKEFSPYVDSMSNSFNVINPALRTLGGNGIAFGVAAFYAAFGFDFISSGFSNIADGIKNLVKVFKDKKLSEKKSEIEDMAKTIEPIAEAMYYISTVFEKFANIVKDLSFSRLTSVFFGIRIDDKAISDSLTTIFSSIHSIVDSVKSKGYSDEDFKILKKSFDTLNSVLPQVGNTLKVFSSEVLPVFTNSFAIFGSSTSKAQQIVNKQSQIRDQSKQIFNVIVDLSREFAIAAARVSFSGQVIKNSESIAQVSSSLARIMVDFADNVPKIQRGANKITKAVKGSEAGTFTKEVKPLAKLIGGAFESIGSLLQEIAPKIATINIDSSMTKKITDAATAVSDIHKGLESFTKVLEQFSIGTWTRGPLYSFSQNVQANKSTIVTSINGFAEIVTDMIIAFYKVPSADSLPKKISSIAESTTKIGEALNNFSSKRTVFMNPATNKMLLDLKNNAQDPNKNTAKLFFDFILESFIKPISESKISVSQIKSSSEVLSKVSEAAVSVGNLLKSFSTDFAEIYQSGAIKKMTSMMGDANVNIGQDLGPSLKTFLRNFINFINQSIIGNIKSVDIDKLSEANEILSVIGPVFKNLKNAFESFDELTMFMSSPAWKKVNETDTKMTETLTFLEGSGELGKTIGKFLTFTNDKILEPLLDTNKKLNLDNMVEASEILKFTAETIKNLTHALLAFGTLADVLTFAKSSKNGTPDKNLADQIDTLITDVTKPELGSMFEKSIPKFLKFMNQSILEPILGSESDMKYNSGDIEEASKILKGMVTVIKSLVDLMNVFAGEIGGVTPPKPPAVGGITGWWNSITSGVASFFGAKTGGGAANQEPRTPSIASGDKLGSVIDDIMKKLDPTIFSKLFKKLQEIFKPILESELDPGSIEFVKETLEAAKGAIPTLVSFVTDLNMQLGTLDVGNIDNLTKKLTSLANFSKSGLIEHFSTSNDYLTRLVGVMQGTADNLMKMVELGNQIATSQNLIAGMDLKDLGKVPNAKAPPAAQIAQVPAVSNSATSPLNPATQTTVNNTVPNAGNATGNVKEENSKSILDKLESAVGLLKQICDKTGLGGGSVVTSNSALTSGSGNTSIQQGCFVGGDTTSGTK